MMRVIQGWFFVAMVARAAVYVPVGVFLLWLAVSIVTVSDGNPFLLLIAAWIGYHGGNFVFGSLAGFGGAPKSDEPGRAATATSGALRRRRLLRRH
jgi:hypothetical protein